MTSAPRGPAGAVELMWLPLGAGPGSALVRLSGRAYEAVTARRDHRPRCALVHTALRVTVDGTPVVVEMTPDWSPPRPGREVVVRGPVGVPWGGRSRLLRYEVHRWPGGNVVDAATAIGGPRWLSEDRAVALRLLGLVPRFPALTWGRDELETGDMWCSNSLTAWLLTRSGHDLAAVLPPPGTRAPGWSAGLQVAGHPPLGPPAADRRP